MSVRIRLSRIGAHKRPFYRVVVAPREKSRNGSCLEILGTFDPKQKREGFKLNPERYQYWLKNGALPTTIIQNLVKRTQRTVEKGGE